MKQVHRFVAILAMFWGAFAAAQPPQNVDSDKSGFSMTKNARIVLVDAVVLDKKHSYVHDLTAKDFKVWEDGKEVPIRSFSFGVDPAAPAANQARYSVLFFDNSTMSLNDQVHAREAAVKFIERSVGPNRLMAVAMYGGSLRVVRNFTFDRARLTAAVSGQQVPLNASGEKQASLLPMVAFNQRNVLSALKSFAKNLASIPGRKTLIFFSAGFKLDTPELRAYLQDAVSALNKANVAVYAVDARGLLAPNGASIEQQDQFRGARLLAASWLVSPAGVYAQKGPPRGGGGPTGGGGTTGTRSPSRTTPRPPMPRVPTNQQRSIIPDLGPNPTDNQELLRSLAIGTGGFVIASTNDLLSGLERIGLEQDEYYSLGYIPPESPEGSCHTIKVKVERSGTEVRSRSGYCDSKVQDLLAGEPVEKHLESIITGTGTSSLAASMRTPYFFISPNTARVSLAMQVPPDSLKVTKKKQGYQATMDVLGIAYSSNGTVAARFSDTAKVEFQTEEDLKQFRKAPFLYEKQFEMASGDYNFKVAFSNGERSGHLEEHLKIDGYDATGLSLSALTLSNNYVPVQQSGEMLNVALEEDRVPLVTNGFQIFPSADNKLTIIRPGALYFEIYLPTAESVGGKLVLRYRVTDSKTGERKFDTGRLDITQKIKPGSPVVPVLVVVPTDKIGPGKLTMEVQVQSGNGNPVFRFVEFEITNQI